MVDIKITRIEDAPALLANMRSRAAGVNAEIDRAAAEIMETVRTGGFEAVREYSLKFDGAEPRELTMRELDEAAARCPKELLRAMERSAENIRAYQKRLLSSTRFWETDGGTLGQIVRPLERVGIYVPGGRAAYPSSVLMTAVPAKTAGVGEVVMVTPPTENLNDAVLAAARIAGVDRVIAVGGAQAVAALTYGAGFIPRVDKLVGPGNAYVAAAKRMAFGQVDIDMVAGPSEVLVIADGSAPAGYVAADMLSQAEHDRLASAVLVTTSPVLAESAARELAYRAERLERREIIESSLENYCAILLCDTLEQACALSDEIAPEHLEIMTKNPKALLPLIKNAGAVFLGQSSPEPLGDYMAGPSHVLPTSGTARFFSPLSAESFLKKMSVIEYSAAGLAALHEEIETFALAEGLTAHAASVRERYNAGDKGEK